MMDPYNEINQQRKLTSLQCSQTNVPDSTTTNSVDRKDPCAELSGKSLASLIAEPAPQQVLTATTTLTVPQSYVPVNNYLQNLKLVGLLYIPTSAKRKKLQHITSL